MPKQRTLAQGSEFPLDVYVGVLLWYVPPDLIGRGPGELPPSPSLPIRKVVQLGCPSERFFVPSGV